MGAARALAQIVYGAEALRFRTSSHRCDCGVCSTPAHCVPETMATNLERSKCSEQTCEHAIPCIFSAHSKECFH